METRLLGIIQEKCCIDLERKSVIGVSGGPDSLFLLHVMWKLGARLVVAHLDHQLRSESGEEAILVAGIARHLGYDPLIESANVEGLVKTTSSSVEEAARTARYRFLFDIAARNDAQAVIVGHTADDQVETVLMHLLRGAGTSGLRGMKYRSIPNEWSDDVPLVRPLLGIWRSEITHYLEENGLSPLHDPSNQDLQYYRNYIRHRLIPFLEEKHPGVRKRIWQTAEILTQDYAVVEGIISDAREKILRHCGEGFVLIDYPSFMSQQTSVQRGVIRWVFSYLKPGLRDFTFDHVQAVLDFTQTPSQSIQRNISGWLCVFLENDNLWIADCRAEIPLWGGNGDTFLHLQLGEIKISEIPCNISFGDKQFIQISTLEDVEGAKRLAFRNTNPYSAWLDADLLTFPLILRTRIPGDRFQPLGMDGHSMKLSDYMINTKLPLRARDTWPLLLSGGEIAWIPGYQIAHPFRISPTTRHVLNLVIEHK